MVKCVTGRCLTHDRRTCFLQLTTVPVNLFGMLDSVVVKPLTCHHYSGGDKTLVFQDMKIR